MPRIPPRLFRQANRQSPHLAALVPACKDLQSARNELRWITEYVGNTSRPHRLRRLARLCRQRGRGTPLQYILGSQPFGHLDIKCRPGVLIPRPETEAYTSHLADLIKSANELPLRGHGLNILDLCTGSACIPLLLFSILQQSYPSLNVLGLDIAPEAVDLGRENISRNRELGHILCPHHGQSLEVARADVFNDQAMQALASRRWDILVSNPPYVSQRLWNGGHGQLAYSVRKYEPRLALVPSNHLPVPLGWEREDAFYARLLDIALLLQPTTILLELGDHAQARRILARFPLHPLAQSSTVELWRDFPDRIPADDEQTRLDVTTVSGQESSVPVKGKGHVRCIHIQRTQRT